MKPGFVALLFAIFAQHGPAQEEVWAGVRDNAARSQRAIQFCRRFAEGWLAHADPVSGLLPRTTQGQHYWNAQDCAADNFPFILLTAHITDNHHLKRATRRIMVEE